MEKFEDLEHQREKFEQLTDPPATMVVVPPVDEEYTLERREASPAHLLTTIKSFSKLSKHHIGTLESTEFEAGDYKWKLIVNLDEDDHISVYLSMVGTSSLPAGWEVNAIFNFFIYNHISNFYTCFRGKARRFHAIDEEWGFYKLMTNKSLAEPCNGYVFKDKCVFGAEVFVIEKQPLIENVCVLNLSQPYKHKWKISEFSKLGSIWYSEEFFVGGYNWNIMMYPDGARRSRGRYVSIFLNCIDSKSFARGEKVHAACLLGFRNMLHDDKNHYKRVRCWFTSASPGWGFDKYKRIGDMRDPGKGFVVDDCCILEIRLSVQALQEEALPLG